MLSEETADEFNKLFNERIVNLEEPLFKAWLVLKNASLPTEAQVLEKIIEDHTAKNIPKRKTKRKRQLPEGPARYDPSTLLEIQFFWRDSSLCIKGKILSM